MRSEPAVLGSGLLQLLQRIPDPRGRLGQRHDFVAMLATVVCAMLCGHGGFEGIAQWIHAFDEHLWHRLGYRRRPPSANCFRDLLNVLNPVAVELALWNWVESLGIEVPADGLQAVIVDGKKLRGAISRHNGMWHVLTAMDHLTGRVLREVPVPQNTNEAKAVLGMLDRLVLQGQVVIGDAMFCQRDICEQILEQGGDYLGIVKGNQPALQRDVQLSFAIPANVSPYRQRLAIKDQQQIQTTEKSRGRLEQRRLTSITAPNGIANKEGVSKSRAREFEAKISDRRRQPFDLTLSARRIRERLAPRGRHKFFCCLRITRDLWPRRFPS